MENNNHQQLVQNEELKDLLTRALVSNAVEDDADLEIDWVGLFFKVYKRWKFILVLAIFFGVMGAAIALSMPKEYTATVSLAPEAQGKGGSSSLGGLASMLGMGSINTGAGSDALNISLFPEISASTPFLTNMFQVQVNPYVSEEEFKKGVEKSESMSLYDYCNKDKGGIVASLKLILGLDRDEDEPNSILDLSHLTKKQAAVVKELQKAISVDVDAKTGISLISVTFDDPQIATQLADTVCQRLQEYIIDYRTQKAKEDLDYYTMLANESKTNMIRAQAAYARSVDFDRSVILQSVNSEKERLQAEAQLAGQVYQQMVTQQEAAKAKYQEMKPVFAVIQPATFPLTPSSKSRKLIVLAFMFVGVILGTTWVMFGDELFTNIKAQFKVKNEE